MKNGLLALLAAALIGAGGLSYWQHRQVKARAAEIEELKTERDNLVQTAARADSQNAVLRASVDALRDSVAWADSVAAERIRVAHRAAQTAEAELRATLTEEQQRTLDELLAAHRLEVDAQADRIDYYIDLVTEQNDLIEGLEASVEHWQAAREAERAIADAWEAQYKATQTLWNAPAFRWAERVGFLAAGYLWGRS